MGTYTTLLFPRLFIILLALTLSPISSRPLSSLIMRFLHYITTFSLHLKPPQLQLFTSLIISLSPSSFRKLHRASLSSNAIFAWQQPTSSTSLASGFHPLRSPSSEPPISFVSGNEKRVRKYCRMNKSFHNLFRHLMHARRPFCSPYS